MTEWIECDMKEEGQPRQRLDSQGYTLRAGSPTLMKVLFAGLWRRVYVWQFSNCGTLFFRVKGELHYVVHVNGEALKAYVQKA